MSKIVLDDTATGFNLSGINENFTEVADALNNKVLYRDNPTGEANQMCTNLDMNGFSILNGGIISTKELYVNGVKVQDPNGAPDSGSSASLWFNGDLVKPNTFCNTGLTEIYGGNSTGGKTVSVSRGTEANKDTSMVPVLRSQWFAEIQNTPGIPWVAHQQIQTTVGTNNTDKVVSSAIEFFHEKPGSSEGIGQIIFATAAGNRVQDPTNSGGDLWGQWIRVSNHKPGGGGWLAHGCAQELNCRNVFPSDLRTKSQLAAAGVTGVVNFEDWQDTRDIMAGQYPTHLMYVLQIFPDYSSRHLTRGISMQPSKDAGAINPNTGLAEKIPTWIGWDTGIMLTGYTQTGLYIDSQIEYVNPGYSWEPNANTIHANPIGITFGYNTPIKMVFQRKNGALPTNDWQLTREANYLLWRKDGANWFQAFDTDNMKTLFQNSMFSMNNAGRLNVGGSTDATALVGAGITIQGDNAFPLVIQKSVATNAVAPGAGNVVIKVLPGSNAGTLQIAAFAGTSTTGKVIVDNIGAGN